MRTTADNRYRGAQRLRVPAKARISPVRGATESEFRSVLLQEHEWRRKEGLVYSSYEGGMPVDEEQFESLLEQVRDLHRQADKITRETTRLQANVQARLSWERDPPPLPAAQREIAEEAIEILGRRELSPAQSGALRRAFFGRR